MDYSALRKLALKFFLVFLGLTALVAIVSVLTGSFGELQLKILATSFAISSASILAMSCAAFIERKKRVVLGISGVLLSAMAACLVIAGLWLESESEGYWKSTFTLVTAAAAFAHAFLLVLPELDAGHRWIQWVSSLSIGILAVQIDYALWAEINSDQYYRFLAVVAIVVGLVTIAIPIMMKMRKGDGPVKIKLELEQLDGDIYRDSAGKEYRLTEIDGANG